MNLSFLLDFEKKPKENFHKKAKSSFIKQRSFTNCKRYHKKNFRDVCGE